VRLKRRAAGVGGLLVALLALAGCPKPAPVVQQQVFSAAEGSLDRVAVLPFYARPELSSSLSGSGVTGEEVSDIVATYFADELRQQGVSAIAPNDLVMAFTDAGLATPRRDPRRAMELASSHFGATSVLMGEVYRWRDREGRNLGAGRPASVGFEVRLYDTRTGRRLWNGRFDETQRPLTEEIRNVRRYPGGGSRWLTASELARWGVGASVDTLVAGQWRSSK
jgi:hypothetical protein